MKIVTNNKKIKSHLTLNGHLINLTKVKVVLKVNNKLIKNRNNNKSVKNKK